MRTIAIIILIFAFKSSFAQIDFVSEIDKAPLHPEIANQIEKIHPENDFQLRFWIDGSNLRLNKKRFFLITLIGKKWLCESYRLDYNKNKEIKLQKENELKSNCDSLWKELVQYNILTLQGMDLLKKEFLSVNENGDTSQLVIADGLFYSIEFVKNNKYKRVEYQCPITYFETYSDIKELSDISNIIKLIYRIFDINEKPC